MRDDGGGGEKGRDGRGGKRKDDGANVGMKKIRWGIDEGNSRKRRMRKKRIQSNDKWL